MANGYFTEIWLLWPNVIRLQNERVSIGSSSNVNLFVLFARTGVAPKRLVIANAISKPYWRTAGNSRGHTSTLDPAAAQALDSSALQAVITRAIQANNCGGAGAVVFYDGPSTWPGDMTLNSYFATTVGAVPAQSLGCHMNAQYAPSLGDPPNTHLLQLVQTNSANYVNRAGVTWAVRNGSWYYFIDNVNRAGGCEFSLANPLVVDDTPHADPNIEPLIAWFIIMPFYVDGQGAFHVDASQGLWYGFDLN